MAVRQATRLSSGLMGKGLPASTPIDVLVNVSKQNEQHLVTTVETLAADIEKHGIDGCAILLVTWPKAVVSRGDHLALGLDNTSASVPRFVPVNSIA